MERSPRIKVVLCITGLEPGGAERAIVELATRLDRRRWEPVVCVLAPTPAAPRDRLLHRLRSAEIPVHFLGATGVLSAPRTLWRLWRAMRRERPAVVQSFLFHANVMAAVAARLAGVVNICTGVRVAERRSPWRLRVERFLTRRWVRRCVCVSRGVADFSISRGFPADRVVVIPNGIEPLSGEPSRADAPAGGGRLTAVGRLTSQKGFDWLLDAMAELRRRRPGVTLRIVGGGELESELRLRAVRLGLVAGPGGHSENNFAGGAGNGIDGAADAVQFVGWCPDVAGVLREANDLFVLTSRWEGMPNVVLEAMNQGLPVVATDVEGVRELLGGVVDDAENAPMDATPGGDSPQIVAFGDTAAWVRKCEAILGDPALGERLGRRNRERVVNDFSIHAMVRRYESLWESLVSE